MTPLERDIREMVAAEGPITVERYMALALGHPCHGYYMTRDPLGAAGDFTTAPEISQMFGELLGLWAVEAWCLMGRPSSVRLVELGPGRGTLVADAQRAARVLPAFLEAAELHLVETSPALRAAQSRTLASVPLRPTWHASLAAVPPGPTIVLANEFLDALPIRQFVRGGAGWHERLVGLDPDGRLAFGLAAEPERGVPPGGRPGEVLERGEAAHAVIRDLALRLASQGGAALIVDYGHLRSAAGDTLQAVRGHAYADPLADPGEADLTAHVDFTALSSVAARAGAAVHGPVTQGELLQALGIEARAAQLRRCASPAAAASIDAALERLTGTGRGQMGTLFKAVALSHPALQSVPGLPPRAIGTRLGADTLEATC